ncbi:flagellin hook IN motif-containing protein, partial [Helicobacter sp. MIT 05-5294]|uniref:flagellin hook IN motif-containing protein n=1 Tax=Helicobacter sp. MIT 05-5294 TaxID=1548150 RepID=UPI001107A66C
GFTNKEFQVGAYSNQTIRASIGATSSDKIGHVRTETFMQTGQAQFGTASLTFTTMGIDRALESVKLSHSAGTGLGVLAEAINRYSDELGGVRAEAEVLLKGNKLSAANSLTGVVINGVNIGVISGTAIHDGDGRLLKAINAYKDTTGVEASITRDGKLQLTSVDGRGISVQGLDDAGIDDGQYVGRLNLTQLGANDIMTKGTYGAGSISSSMSASAVTTLRNIKGEYSDTTKASIGVVSNAATEMGAGVMSLKGAMLVMDIAESAIKQLDTIRSDLGSVQQQMQSTINNITITQVNVKSAESGIREVDF